MKHNNTNTRLPSPFFKFLFIWPFHPTNFHPHPTLCHSVLYFMLYEFFVFILHIYSELSQEFYFICCTVLYLYCSAHIKLHQLRNFILAFTSFSTYFRMHVLLEIDSKQQYSITIYFIHPREMGRTGKIKIKKIISLITMLMSW